MTLEETTLLLTFEIDDVEHGGIVYHKLGTDDVTNALRLEDQGLILFEHIPKHIKKYHPKQPEFIVVLTDEGFKYAWKERQNKAMRSQHEDVQRTLDYHKRKK